MPKLCDYCHQNKSELSGVLNGIYYKNLCKSCNSPVVSSGHARWSRSIDAEDHEADIQQPYTSEGKINTKFARLYPDKARAIFSEEDIRKAELNL